MKSRSKYFFLAFFSLLLSVNCYAWNALGHMVVANIAYQHLQPNVKSKVDKMVATLAQEYPDTTTYPQMAAWPDAIRSQRIESFTHWHYIDVAISDTAPPSQQLVDTDNIVWAIGKIQPVVHNKHANPYEKARFLAFLTHLVGDAHQPLHNVSRVSAEHPDGDRGGNLYYLKETTNIADLKPLSLHHLWDTGCGVFNGESSQSKVASLTQIIEAAFPEAYFGDAIKNPTADDWVKEGVALAPKSVYNTPENHPPTRIYLDTGKKIAEQRVALAGYRLAYMLNTILGDNNNLPEMA